MISINLIYFTRNEKKTHLGNFKNIKSSKKLRMRHTLKYLKCLEEYVVTVQKQCPHDYITCCNGYMLVAGHCLSNNFYNFDKN